MTVVVISHWFDPTADHVVHELNRRGVPVFRFDTADFPARLSATAVLGGGAGDCAWTGSLRTPERQVGLGEVSGILYRRPTVFCFPRAMDQAARPWATQEARIGFGGLLAGMDRWLNHPHRIASAEYKPVQLQQAQRCGLAVPRSMITNDPAAARAFCDQIGDVIYKPLSAAEAPAGRGPQTIYASRVPEADYGAPSIGFTAHLFQERIAHRHAVRAVVVDHHIVATAIHARSAAARMDWRSDYDALSYEPAELPGHVTAAVRALMARLGLRFGVLDFLVRPGGEHVFLEINPNGQWAWIDHAAGPVAAAIADALAPGSAA